MCNDVDSLSKWLKSFEFVLLATFWFKVLQAINDVSLLLQDSNITIDEELHLIKSLEDDLKRIRESWNVILEESKLVASTLSQSQHFQEKRRRISRTFHDGNQAKKCEGQDEETLFQINVFNVTLDTVNSQVIHRFETTKQVNNMSGFLWNPPSTTEEVENTYKAYCPDLSKFYPNDLNEKEIFEELRFLNKRRQNDNLFGKLSSLELVNKIYEKGLQTILPQICVALRIFISISVSVASGKRSFSKLAVVKNCRRSTMGQGRLSGLILLSSEHDLARKYQL